MTLDFKGPLPYDKFIHNEKKNADVGGIYIWGFEGLKLDDPQKVIPYYVGLKVDSVFARIINHRINILSLNSTYKRLSEDYFHQFFYSTPKHFPSFPLITNNDNKKKKLNWGNGWTYPNDYSKCFDYINNFDFLYSVKGVKDPSLAKSLNDFPIYFIKKIIFKDTLADRINAGNFWVYYATVDTANETYKEILRDVGGKNRNAFEILEAFVKYSLKGVTVSKSKTINCCLKYNLEVNSETHIFKNSASNIFPGY